VTSVPLSRYWMLCVRVSGVEVDVGDDCDDVGDGDGAVVCTDGVIVPSCGSVGTMSVGGFHPPPRVPTMGPFEAIGVDTVGTGHPIVVKVLSDEFTLLPYISVDTA